MFVMIDGIDGAGKSTIMSYWKEHLAQKNYKIFDLKAYVLTHKTFPEANELLPYDVIFSAEPTHAWIGAAIREELIKTNTQYDPLQIATAYALDRLVLYTRILMPLREKGKIILQDRGVSTSLCYQSIQSEALNMNDIASIAGNQFALSHAPDHLVIANISTEVALERLQKRLHKNDDSFFEKESFLKKAQQCFLSDEFQKKFTEHNTQITVLNTDLDYGTLKAQAIKLLDTILPNN